MSPKYEIFLRGDPEAIGKVGENHLKEVEKRMSVRLEGKEELEPEEREREILLTMNKAMKGYLNELNLAEFELDFEHVHIIEPKKFARIKARAAGDEPFDAFFQNGHAFLKRDGSNDFIANLSHVAAHSLSAVRTRLVVEEIAGEKKLYEKEEPVQEGYKLFNRKSGDLGVGFNEAVTEVMAHSLRGRYIEETASEGKKIGLPKDDHYKAQIYLVEELAERLDPENPEEAMNELARGYVNNDPAVWKRLHQIFKEMDLSGRGVNGLKTLLQMNATPESALQTAKRLGWIDAERKIRPLVSESKKAAKAAA